MQRWVPDGELCDPVGLGSSPGGCTMDLGCVQATPQSRLASAVTAPLTQGSLWGANETRRLYNNVGL